MLWPAAATGEGEQHKHAAQAERQVQPRSLPLALSFTCAPASAGEHNDSCQSQHREQDRIHRALVPKAERRQRSPYGPGRGPNGQGDGGVGLVLGSRAEVAQRALWQACAAEANRPPSRRKWIA